MSDTTVEQDPPVDWHLTQVVSRTVTLIDQLRDAVYQGATINAVDTLADLRDAVLELAVLNPEVS